MTWKPRNQNNIIPFAKGVKNKLAEEAEEIQEINFINR